MTTDDNLSIRSVRYVGQPKFRVTPGRVAQLKRRRGREGRRGDRMSVILAMRAKLAAAVRGRLDGEVYEHHGARLARVPDTLQSVEGPAQLVRLAGRREAKVLALDVRLGGQRYFAMDAVRQLLEVPDNGLAVVLITPAMTHAFVKHAWELGVFSAIEDASQERDEMAAQVSEQVYRALAWRDGLSPRGLPWLAELGPRPSTPSSSLGRKPQRRRAAQG